MQVRSFYWNLTNFGYQLKWVST